MKRKTPISDLALEADWPAFVTTLAARLRKGKEAYGDKSFSREPLELTQELAQEALDLAGWAFILWRRLSDIERAIREAEKPNGRIRAMSKQSILSHYRGRSWRRKSS